MLNHTLEHSVSANDLRDLEAAVLSLSFADRWALKLGSWQAQVLATHPGQLETLKYLYKQIAESELSGNVSCKLYLVDVGSFPDFKAFADRLLTERTIPPDGYLTRKLSSAECGNYDSASVLMTEMAMLVSVADRESERIYVFVINDQPIYEFQVHLSFLVNYALFNSGRLYLHAGAVRFADRVRLFVGERGAGKSTVCLRLGQAGATVLSDDHVMIRKDDGNFFVSGCGELARVTEKTEGFLFNTPLNARANDYAGLLKKEFRIDEYFSAEPTRDY
ncbi:MAG TPA: hypothetical protein VEF04_09625, partial [Blastocatellia bacterium]|nr:hypothetical protein [Blastocatellia bacterium]